MTVAASVDSIEVTTRPLVRVYFNLHKRQFSVMSWDRGPTYGRLLTHCELVYLCDVTFVVQPAGRARVLAERTKNVHAFVQGRWMEPPATFDASAGRRLRYDPYEAASFRADGVDVRHADWVIGTVVDGQPVVRCSDTI